MQFLNTDRNSPNIMYWHAAIMYRHTGSLRASLSTHSAYTQNYSNLIPGRCHLIASPIVSVFPKTTICKFKISTNPRRLVTSCNANELGSTFSMLMLIHDVSQF